MSGSPSKIRIAYLIDTIACDTAGTQKQLLETISRLDREKFSPQLICLWESAWMACNALPCDVTILGYRGFLKWSFPGVVRRFLQSISQHRFHIIQTFFEDSLFVGFLGGVLGRPQPVLLSSRRDMGLGAGNQPWYHRLFTLVQPWVMKKFAGVVTNSAQVGKYVIMKEKVPASQIKVIPNGIAMPVRSSAVPNIFSGHEQDLWIGIAASLTPVKRHDILFEALALMKREDTARLVRLMVLGDGPERDNLTVLAERLGIDSIVHFAGAVPDVPAYLFHLDIGVLCSDREGLSNAVLEYMACGLPAVVTSVGGNVELVDEDNGRCVPPGDPAALSKALLQLVDDDQLRLDLGRNALRKIKATYSWERAMADLESYYCELVATQCVWVENDRI